MVQLLKIKEQIIQFISRFEIYVNAAVHFVIAYAAFSLITSQVGFMESLEEYPIPLLLALLCSFLPAGAMLFCGAMLILIHFYALSIELCAIAAMIFIILSCLYFRFSSGKGLYTMLTGVLSYFGIPYVMPCAAGLVNGPYSVISVLCGSVVYFLLKSVKENAALFVSSDGSRKTLMTLAINQILGNKEMYLYLVAFAVAAILVYCIRKLTTDHAHMIALIIGSAAQMGIVCCGEIYIGNASEIWKVIIGCVISLVILFAFSFMRLSLDYSRVEHTQFEDDEYYYYVKAVPKAFVAVPDKQVKKINAKKAKRHNTSRKKRMKSAQVQKKSTSQEKLMTETLRQDFETKQKE